MITMKYYCVTCSVDNHGRVTAAITAECEADKQPENSFASTAQRDIYSDWFRSREEAEAFAASAADA